MGYRALLKKYMRHVELIAGENYVDREAGESVLSNRDLGELRTLQAELRRSLSRKEEA